MYGLFANIWIVWIVFMQVGEIHQSHSFSKHTKYQTQIKPPQQPTSRQKMDAHPNSALFFECATPSQLRYISQCLIPPNMDCFMLRF